MSTQNKSIQRLNENIGLLVKELRNLRINGTDAYADKLVAAAGDIAAADHGYSLGVDAETAVKEVAESLRQCARQDIKPPCGESRTKAVKHLAPASVPETAVSESEWHDVMNKWCDTHYPQSVDGVVQSVWWESNSNQLGVVVKNPTDEQRAEIERSLQRLRVGTSCCLYPWPPEGIDYSIIDVT